MSLDDPLNVSTTTVNVDFNIGSITSRCSGIRAVTGKIKDGTQGQQKSSLENFFFTLKTVSNCVTGEDI